jgi:hypothetical protein
MSASALAQEPPSAEVADGDLEMIEALAKSMQRPRDLVQEHYTRALADLRRDAHIQDFVKVCAQRRVRDALRKA